MLPAALVGTYERYKHDTAVFCSWLVQTARRNGYSEPLLSDKGNAGGGTPKLGRPKGKARKQMKEAAAAAAASTSEPPPLMEAPKRGHEYVLAINKFVPLAEFIARKGPSANTVPPAIVATLNRVIRVRKWFSTQLEGDAAARAASKESAKHSFFVGRLEQVHAILEPLMGVPETAKEEAPASSKLDSTNPFAELHVYEPSEAFLNAPDVEGGVPKYVPETEDTLVDAYLAFVALLQDASLVRGRVENLWTIYQEGTLQLGPTAVAVNTAIRMVRQAEEAITPLLDKHGGIGWFLENYCAGMCRRAGVDYYQRQCPEDDINMAAYSICDHCFVNSWKLLDDFSRAHQPNRLSVYNGQYGWYNESLVWKDLPFWQRYIQDKAVLMELLSDMPIIDVVLKNNPAQDEFTHGVLHLLESRHRPPFWTAFAAQTFLDRLHLISGRDLHRPCEAMLNCAARLSRSIDGAMEYHRRRGLTARKWQSIDEATLRMLVGLCRFWDDDPINKFRHRYGLPTRPFVFLHRHALLCGTWTHFMLASFHQYGTIFTRNWGSIMHMQNLYQAMRREGLLGQTDRKGGHEDDSSWNDMELVLAQQGLETFFVGGQLPENATRDFNNYSLCTGYSTANWVPPGRRKQIKFGNKVKTMYSAAGPRSLKTLGPVSTRFLDMLHFRQSSGMTTEDVRLILAAGSWKTALLDLDASMATDAGGGMSRQENQKKAGGGYRSDKDKKTTPSKFVFQIAYALQAEIAEIAFDYFGLHITCWEMLDSMHKSMGPRLRALFTPKYLDSEYQYPSLVGYIFMLSSGRETYPDVDPFELMRLAAEPMQKMIKRHGRDVEKNLEKLGIFCVLGGDSSEDSDGSDSIGGGKNDLFDSILSEALKTVL